MDHKNEILIKGEKKPVGRGGITFFTAVAIVLAILKILGLIEWSWWIILFPLYAKVVFGTAGILLIYALGYLFLRGKNG